MIPFYAIPVKKVFISVLNNQIDRTKRTVYAYGIR